MNLMKYKLETDKQIKLFIDVEETPIITDKRGSFKIDNIGGDAVLTIYKGYLWNGCTPSFHILGLIKIGVPDGVIKESKPWLYYPSLVHDIFCRNHKNLGISRKNADYDFLQQMKKAKWPLAKVYYFFVRAFAKLRGL